MGFQVEYVPGSWRAGRGGLKSFESTIELGQEAAKIKAVL